MGAIKEPAGITGFPNAAGGRQTHGQAWSAPFVLANNSWGVNAEADFLSVAHGRGAAARVDTRGTWWQSGSASSGGQEVIASSRDVSTR